MNVSDVLRRIILGATVSPFWEEGPVRPSASQLPLHQANSLFSLRAALIEDLLSATGVRLKLYVASDQWATDVNVDGEEDEDQRTVISGFSFGPGLSPV